jgi:hypothetical protein
MMRFMAGENKYIEKLKSGFRNQAFFVVNLLLKLFYRGIIQKLGRIQSEFGGNLLDTDLPSKKGNFPLTNSYSKGKLKIL